MPNTDRFYVSCIDGTRKALIAGPYDRHIDAMLAKAPAVELAEKGDPRADFYAFGTARVKDDDGTRKCVLGIVPPRMPTADDLSTMIALWERDVAQGLPVGEPTLFADAHRLAAQLHKACDDGTTAPAIVEHLEKSLVHLVRADTYAALAAAGR